MLDDMLDHVPEPPRTILRALSSQYSAPAAKDQSSEDGHLAARQEAPHQPAGARRSTGLLYSAIVVGVLLVAGIGGYLYWVDSARTDIAVNGIGILNAEQLVADAEALVEATLSFDGATLTGNERCYFAGASATPKMLCGPAWVGRSAADEPWLEVRVDYMTNDGSATGQIIEISDSVGGDIRTFNRPDGKRPSEPGEPVYSSTGPRTQRGSQILDLPGALALAEQAFVEAIAAADPLDLSVVDDPRCFFVEGPDQIHSVPVTNNDLLCGPLRSVTSDADEIWSAVQVSYDRGEFFGTAIPATVRVLYFNTSSGWRPVAPRDGEQLSRPDGLPATNADDLDRPARPADYSSVQEQPHDLDLKNAARLVTSDYSVDFEGFARAERIGSGSEAIIAAPGFELAVASITANEQSGQVRGTVQVDGVEQPLPNWRLSGAPQLLVVSVPAGTERVVLTVEDDGRPQTISLDDGQLVDGFPLALYRESPLQLDRPLAGRIVMPAGEALLIAGSLESVRWVATDADGDWLAPKQSRLLASLDSWTFDRPCCEVTIGDITSTVSLIDDATGRRIQDSRVNEFDDHAFLVDEEVTSVTLRIDFVASISVDDVVEELDETIEIPLELP